MAPRTSPKPGGAESSVGDSEDDEASGSPSIAPSIAPSITPNRTEAQRRAYLEADSRVEEFKDHEVQCKDCKRLIKLGTARKYMLQKWNLHKQRCSSSM